MFIQRAATKITGAFMNRQPGFAEEWIDDNSPELLAFLAKSQSPNWRGFAGAMMEDAGYDRITNVVMGLSLSKGKLTIVNLVAVIGYDNPNLARVKALWNELVGHLTLLQKPTASEIAEWNRLATLYSVPLTFGSGGLIA